VHKVQRGKSEEICKQWLVAKLVSTRSNEVAVMAKAMKHVVKQWNEAILIKGYNRSLGYSNGIYER
jgi:hypothetical protein